MIARYLVSRLYIIKRAKGRGLYPGVRQKSPNIDLVSGLHKQLIENVVQEMTLTNLGASLGFHSAAASLGVAYE